MTQDADQTIATPNTNVNPWYLVARLEARLEREGSITVESWNEIMWAASNAARFQR